MSSNHDIISIMFFYFVPPKLFKEKALTIGLSHWGLSSKFFVCIKLFYFSTNEKMNMALFILSRISKFALNSFYVCVVVVTCCFILK